MTNTEKFGIDIRTAPPGNWRLTINGKLKKSYSIDHLVQLARNAGNKASKDEIIRQIVWETVPFIQGHSPIVGVLDEKSTVHYDKNIYVMLGRAGDILCLLPALYYEYQRTKERQKLVVAKEFASILEGCTYVEPIIFEDDFRKPAHAANWISKQYPTHRVLNCAVCAEDMRVDQKGWSFDRDIWTNSKINAVPHSMPLLFDNRSKEREEALKKQYTSFNKKIVLLALEGHSSPFFWKDELKAALQKLSPRTEFVDISNIKAERIYDLLGLYDSADTLIAIDSAPLHLARASKIKTVALVTDQNTLWHQSSWSPFHTLRVPYSNAVKKAKDIADVINGEYSQRRIFWVTSSAQPKDERESNRQRMLTQSIENENQFSGGAWVRCDFTPTRDGSSIEDAPVPFIRDMLNTARSQAKDTDILLIVNSDIGMCPGITGEILDACNNFGSCYSQRHDFSKIDRLALNEIEVGIGRKYPGADLFAFEATWWDKHKDFFPDMLLGREAWDMIMRDLVRSTGGIELNNAIYHEMHDSHWLRYRKCNGNEHNKRLAVEWLAGNGRQWWK